MSKSLPPERFLVNAVSLVMPAKAGIQKISSVMAAWMPHRSVFLHSLRLWGKLASGMTKTCWVARSKLLVFLIICISLPIVVYPETESHNTLVVFFRSDCPPCRKEMEIIPEMAEQHKELVIEIVSLDRSGKQSLFGQLPANTILVVAGKKEMEMIAKFGNKAQILPFSAFLSEDGSVCGTHYGILGTDLINDWSQSC